MKAISIHAQYVIEILDGQKKEEYRTWPTSYRGDILICSTASAVSRGAAYIVAELYDCVKDDDIYAFRLRNVRAIKPFVVKGQQRIFNVEISGNLEYFKPNTVFQTVDEEIEFLKACWKKPPTEKEIVDIRAEIEAERAAMVK